MRVTPEFDTTGDCPPNEARPSRPGSLKAVGDLAGLGATLWASGNFAGQVPDKIGNVAEVQVGTAILTAAVARHHILDCAKNRRLCAIRTRFTLFHGGPASHPTFLSEQEAGF